MKRSRFFELLDDRLCPADEGKARAECAHSFANSIKVLRELAIDLNDVQRVLMYFRERGARCDCDVLMKVAEKNRFRTRCLEQGR
ncbi:MAG TPA: hypothetical protein VGJ21_02120 [Terracidiphilus sp.]